MPPSIKNGTLIIEEGLALPSGCDLKTLPFCAGWRAITSIQADGADKRFSAMGWTCFQKGLASSVNMIGLGNAHTLIKAFQKFVRDCGPVKFKLHRDYPRDSEELHGYLIRAFGSTCQKYQAAFVVRKQQLVDPPGSLLR